MSKHALIVTADERLLPGVHAMLNAMKYYGWPDNLEFHFLYWPGKNTEKFISDMQTSGHYPNLVPVNLLEYKDEYGGETEPWRPVYYLKFYRSLYAGRLTDYDAAGFMDADRAIMGDISPYFTLAQQSGRICMIDHKYSQERQDSGWYNTIASNKEHPLMGTGGCPFDPAATFFDPKIYGKDFGMVREYAKKFGNSEMPNMNYMLVTHSHLPNILKLPTMRWNVRRWTSLDTLWTNDSALYNDALHGMPFDRNDKWHLWIKDVPGTKLQWIEGAPYHRTQIERSFPFDNSNIFTMLAIHGRWWFRATLQKKTAKAVLFAKRGRESCIRQNNNVHNIWEVFKFFNFDCYTKLDPWMPEWGSYDEYIDLETGELLRRE